MYIYNTTFINMMLTLGAAITIKKILTYLPYVHNKMKPFFFHLHQIILLVSSYHPLLLDFSDTDNDNVETSEKKDEENDEKKEKRSTRFEDKYLDRYKNFPNEYQFTELELMNEQNEFERIKITSEKERFNTINELEKQLSKINEIIKDGGIKNSEEGEYNIKNINQFGKSKLISYFQLEEDDYDNDPENDFEEIFLDLIVDKIKFEEELKKVEESVLDEEKMKTQARETVLNSKLDKFMDNYILEHTPLGNIYMRYNNSKKSFEYFSNNTIPYRYLESAGRKYVMTYWCKPLFIDIEEELKRAEVKYEEDKKKKEDHEKKRIESNNNNNMSKDVIARLKNYNKENLAGHQSTSSYKPQAKNRAHSNYALPPQVKLNLPNVNETNSSEKQLLKENANRYTWEGRLTNFCPLKKIDKKVVDKKLTLSFSDFKKMKK